MSATVHEGDAIDVLSGMPAGSIQCAVTSPPYWQLRDYGVDGQLGLEPTPDDYIGSLCAVLRGLRRVLADDGTAWLNLGDGYTSRSDGYRSGATYEAKQPRQRPRVEGETPKNLRLIPWRVALALQADGWIVRSAVIWYKVRPNGRPAPDRPLNSYETLLLLVKQRFYRYQHAPGAEHDVWAIPPDRTRHGHVAPMPLELARRCIAAGSHEGDTVLDPFAGSGTTLLAAEQLGRDSVGIELSPAYAALIRDRLGLLAEESA